VLPKVESLPLLLLARKEVAYGQQVDYFDHPNCIGWVRQGDKQHRGSGCAVVLSNGEAGNKFMSMGQAHKGKKFIDLLGHLPNEIILNEQGEAEFHCPPGSVSLWMEKRKANKLRKLLL
jgi:alpha-amylase